MNDISVLSLVGFFFLALVAGIIDAMAGGGGLLNLPALMAAGLPPTSAIATSKFQGIFSSLSATVHFWRMGKVRLREHWLPAFGAFFGSIGGAISLTYINADILRVLVPFFLIGIALWLLLSPKLGDIPRTARLSLIAYALIFIPFIGFYNGFFGPCTGTFFALGSVALLGLKLGEATIQAKLYNFMSTLGSLLFFLFDGHVVWTYGCVMAVGTIIGGTIGARLILRHGTSLIKPVLVTVSLLMSLKLLWQQGFLQKIFLS